MVTSRGRQVQLLVLLLAGLVVGGCSVKINTQVQKAYPPTSYDQIIEVIEIYQTIPSGAEILGDVKIGDTGFSTDCGYKIAVEAAKIEARKIGENAIKIYEHKMPSAMGSTCHRIKAHIIRIPA